ncbi:MAG: ABC transporter substrate-binding protein [Phycisphaerae bacterium]|nr:ABC transporter substrate-binding protein [Phycisphaerae bacterium]MDW8261115.1 ABC transporter substrate-binding protein [Phycisphaerales bacterium]
MAWKATPIWNSLPVLILLAACSAVVPAQIVPATGPAHAPTARSDDPRVASALRFARAYNQGRVGDALQQTADLDAMFQAMFGADWDDSSPDARAEMTHLYIRLMNLAFERSADAPPAPQPTSEDVVIHKSEPDSAVVRVTVYQDQRPMRLYLDMVRRGRLWKITDLHEAGEPSWVNEIQRRWVIVKGNTTPQAFIRELYVGVARASRPPATQPE